MPARVRKACPPVCARPLSGWSAGQNPAGGMAGSMPSRRAQVRKTCGAPKAWTKSWASWPILGSGCCIPKVSRIGRLSHGPGSGSRGHVPSFNPPSITVCGCTRRASSKPRIESRVSPFLMSRTGILCRCRRIMALAPQNCRQEAVRILAASFRRAFQVPPLLDHSRTHRRRYFPPRTSGHQGVP